MFYLYLWEHIENNVLKKSDFKLSVGSSKKNKTKEKISSKFSKKKKKSSVCSLHKMWHAKQWSQKVKFISIQQVFIAINFKSSID